MGRKAQISMSLWICFRWGGRHRYLCLYGSDSGGEEGTDIYVFMDLIQAGRKSQISMCLWICFRWGGRHRYLCLYGSASGGEEGTDI